MNTKIILDFLTDLSKNNAKEWMNQNKAAYKEAYNEFADLVQEFIVQLSEADPSIRYLNSRDLIFRLNRDTRFSHDKSPYNPSFRAHISSGGRVPVPVGYFINVTPEDIFLGGGLFASQFSDATGMVRNYIVKHGSELEQILHDGDFSKYYTLMGEKLKNIPRGYESDAPYGEFLKHKSWFIENHISPDEFLDTQHFIAIAKERFLLMKPFNDFLNRALIDFKMPVR